MMPTDEGRLPASLRALPRVLFSAVFLLAGFSKLIDPHEFARQVADYGIVSGQTAFLTAYLLISLELVLGLALLVGFQPRLTLAFGGLLLLFFVGVTAYAWSQGKTEGCGCFGSLASRTPAEVLLEDLAFLGLGILAWRLHRGPVESRRWPGMVVALGLIPAIILPIVTYELPLDPLVLDLELGSRVSDLPLQESPTDLAQGLHLVALLELDAEEAASIVSTLNRYQEVEGAPQVTAFYGGEVDERVVFCFNYDPNFEVVAVPRSELKRMYRKPPRFILLDEGKVARIWDGSPPEAGEWAHYKEESNARSGRISGRDGLESRKRGEREVLGT